MAPNLVRPAGASIFVLLAICGQAVAQSSEAQPNVTDPHFKETGAFQRNRRGGGGGQCGQGDTISFDAGLRYRGRSLVPAISGLFAESLQSNSRAEASLSWPPLLAKLPRRNTGHSAEGAGKMRWIRVAGRERDLDNFGVRLAQQFAGILKPDGVEQV